VDQHWRCRLITDKEIQSFARTLQPTDLHRIATELNISSSMLEQYRTSEPQLVSVQAFRLLTDWTANVGGGATVANFVVRMRSAGIADSIIKSAVVHSG